MFVLILYMVGLSVIGYRCKGTYFAVCVKTGFCLIVDIVPVAVLNRYKKMLVRLILFFSVAVCRR